MLSNVEGTLEQCPGDEAPLFKDPNTFGGNRCCMHAPVLVHEAFHHMCEHLRSQFDHVMQLSCPYAVPCASVDGILNFFGHMYVSLKYVQRVELLPVDGRSVERTLEDGTVRQQVQHLTARGGGGGG